MTCCHFILCDNIMNASVIVTASLLASYGTCVKLTVGRNEPLHNFFFLQCEVFSMSLTFHVWVRKRVCLLWNIILNYSEFYIFQTTTNVCVCEEKLKNICKANNENFIKVLLQISQVFKIYVKIIQMVRRSQKWSRIYWKCYIFRFTWDCYLPHIR